MSELCKNIEVEHNPNYFMDYDYCWHDVMGNIGVLLLVASYLGLQLGKIAADGFWYSLLNLLVAIFLGVNLYHRPNLSSIIIEIFWGAISIYGLIRCYRVSYCMPKDHN